MVALTIGMATYNDFDGVYFTVQALRLYQDLADTEILVIDNYGCDDTRSLIEGWVRGRYIRQVNNVGTAASRDLLFREGNGEAILCLDSHILLEPGVIARLKAYYRDHPTSSDLLQGPLIYDDLHNISTHFDPVWRDQMWGIWATDPRGADPEGEPFEILMQGLGLFSCRKVAWQGFNPLFRGFGGEEGYIHEKFRQAGGRALCLPWLRWLHRFGRPRGVPYPLSVEDKLRNYIIGHAEIGLDLMPIMTHFNAFLPQDRVIEIAAEALGESQGATLAIEPDSFAVVQQVAAAMRGRGQPLVSCICTTYNRPPNYQTLLEESIESFLRQDYPNKELIVLNDCPGQELVCDAPGVRVINVPERFLTWGEKLNYAIRASSGDRIAIWDDDDINLPWRLSLSVTRMGDNDYFNPGDFWFLDDRGFHIEHAAGIGHNLSLFTRAAFESVGGYPAVSFTADADLDRLFVEQLPRVQHPNRNPVRLTTDEWYYIYRWGVSPQHLSEFHDDSGYTVVGQRPVVPGHYVLFPHWQADYEEETRAIVARRAAMAAAR